MKTFARVGVTLGIALALSLAAHAAFAIEYDDVLKYTQQGVSDRAIVELIVKDGRAFDMNSDERNQLRDADVSEIVIRAMEDPQYGQDWLDGKVETPPDYGDEDNGGYDNGDETDNGTDSGTYQDEDGIPSGGYSTSLDEEYGNGYSAGYADGHTSLVFSFGYYYGPLARYYFCDPFYYPFWYHGYAYSYWPSYYAYWWRPSYAWYYPYPYNWYDYNSYYCYTYYDPGYYVDHGYRVLPGYGRTIWDKGPRWRDGGRPPQGPGRPGAHDRVLNGRFAESEGLGRPGGVAPPVIREALAQRSPLRDRVGAGQPVERTPVVRGGTIERGGTIDRTPIDRTPIDRVGGRTIERGAPIERGTPVDRGGDRGTRVERTPRRISGLGDFLRGSEPTTRPQPSGDRVQRSEPRVIRGGSGGRGIATPRYDGGIRREFPSARGQESGSRGRGVFAPRQQPAPSAPREVRGGGESRGGGEARGGSRGESRGNGGGDRSGGGNRDSGGGNRDSGGGNRDSGGDRGGRSR